MLPIQSTPPTSSPMKYERPQILLVDTDEEVVTKLKSNGYNVTVGTFGERYRINPKTGHHPLNFSGSLPTNYTEQDIVVIDQTPRHPMEQPSGYSTTLYTYGSISPLAEWITISGEQIIDSRLLCIKEVEVNFNRILGDGGLFIVFTSSRFNQSIGDHNSVRYSINNWEFLSLLSNVVVNSDTGHQVVPETGTLFYKVLSKYCSDVIFDCTLSPVQEPAWKSLAKNRFGKTIAALFTPIPTGNGRVLLLPHLKDKAGFLSDLLSSELPELSPHLFPDSEGGKWVEKAEYELPKVIEINQQIIRLEEETARQVSQLRENIEQERASLGYQHELLTETGEKLISAVKKCLEQLGFKDVVDIDLEEKNSGSKKQKREDLQIRDAEVLVLVEAKGLIGGPKEEDSLAVQKYILPRARNLDISPNKIRGLAIINHERNLPALIRNPQPFQNDVITNATEHGFGLITTWNLFRLVRAYFANQWKHEHIRELFYKNGLIDPIPSHYEPLGVIEDIWPKAGAVGIRLSSNELRKGDRIAFDLPAELNEQIAASMQINRNPVAEGKVGDLVGVETTIASIDRLKGCRVFRVVNAS